MKITPFLLLSLCFCYFSAKAFENTKTTVSGKIQDESKEPIAYASIGLFSLPDSNYAGGTASDISGKFELEAEKGLYFLKISYLSFNTRTINIQVSEEKTVELPTITLSASTTNLGEVTVEADRSQMELLLDKRVFNVGKDLSNTGGTAQNVLQNIPSVTIDVEGNVELRGSQNVRILINGKPSGLVGIDPATALEQIPANLIERVEVITNPSARYDAEGEVGIINIILKKENNEGVNGSFEAKAGWPTNTGLTAVINYRRKKVNYFGSYGIAKRENPGFGNSYQEFYNSDSLLAYGRTREHVRGGFSQTIRLGADIMANENNTFSISGLYKNGQGSNSALLVYTDYALDGTKLEETTRNEMETEPENNVEFALSHAKKFAQKGREWNSEFRYIINDETELSQITETYTKSINELFQRSSNTEDELNWLAQSDYIQPFRKGKFETGVKSSHRLINNDFLVEQHRGDELWKTFAPFDNHFVYTENIQAAYLMLSNEITEKISYQAGIRAEYSEISTRLIDDDFNYKRSYLNFFPSLHFTKKLKNGQSMQLSYSRRLSRPSFRHLLPFYGFSDNRNFTIGNPNLNPEYTHSFEAGYVKYMKKGSFLSTLYYRNRNGVIERITQADDKGILVRMPVNLSTQNAFGLELSGNFDPTKYWRLTGSLNAYRAVTQGVYEGINLYAQATTLNGRISSNLKIKKKLTIQTSFDYEAPRNNTQGKTLSRYAFDLGLNYPILKEKGTVSFSGNDIFNSRRYRWVTETENFYNTNDFLWRSRTFTLTFSYRLNNYQEQRRKKAAGFDVNDQINAD